MRRVLPVVLALLAVLVWQSPAQAATHTVTLSATEQDSAITIRVGDTVTFDNRDSVTHHLQNQSRNWSLNVRLAAGKKAVTASFTAPGTFTYTDTYPVGLLNRTVSSSITVPAAPPSPTPTKSAAPRPSATASARPARSPGATANPTQTGVAVPPPITGAVVPTPSVTPSSGPVPQVAPPALPSTPTPEPSATTSVTYSDKKLTQGSAHGFGLPAALAVVGVVGVVSLIVRLLLAAPEARPDVG